MCFASAISQKRLTANRFDNRTPFFVRCHVGGESFKRLHGSAPETSQSSAASVPYQRRTQPGITYLKNGRYVQRSEANLLLMQGDAKPSTSCHNDMRSSHLDLFDYTHKTTGKPLIATRKQKVHSHKPLGREC